MNYCWSVIQDSQNVATSSQTPLIKVYKIPQLSTFIHISKMIQVLSGNLQLNKYEFYPS